MTHTPKRGVLERGGSSADRSLAASAVVAAGAFSPNEHYRTAFKKGMTSGWDVQAAQIALNSCGFRDSAGHALVEDGIFGERTDQAVRACQRSLGVKVDGIAGPITQATLVARECDRVRHITPDGLLKGIALGESGGYWAATSPLYPDGSRDYGPLQDNLHAPSPAALREAFEIPMQAHEVAVARRSAFEFFLGQPGAVGDEAAWRLATLSYNWPAAANQIAAGRASTWTYTEAGTGVVRKLSDPAPWVEVYGIPGVRSGLDWTRFYVDGKVIYVTSWTVT